MALSLPPLASLRGLAAAALCAGLLAGCGSALSGMVPGMAGNSRVDLDRVSRDKLEKFGTPILRATVPALGKDLLLSPRDARGDVVTWEAAEGITFAFRNGVLIETRGLGADLMSAAVPPAGAIAGGGSHRRSYFFVSEEDRNERRDYLCSPDARGDEELAVYGRLHRTRHVAEVCLRPEGRITNDFWFEGGAIRKSRQWIGPYAGYATFLRIVD